MNSFTDSCCQTSCFKCISLVALITIFTLCFTSCSTKHEPYSIIEFTGNGEFYNYSRSAYPIFYESDSIQSTALLVGKGDIIVYGENNCFWFKDTVKKSFAVKTINNVGFINDKINSLTIPSNEDMVPWFKQMKSNGISELGFLYFDSVIVESYMPYLTDLAEKNPDIGLGYYGDLKDMERMFSLFDPGFIIGVDLSQDDFYLLHRLGKLEFLSASLSDSIYTTPLPSMPKLKQLILYDLPDEIVIPYDFLINNKQIERLSITGTGKFDLLLTEPLVNLKELIISEPDTIENFNLIINHKQIELLSVTGDKFTNDLSMYELRYIRWLTFNENATQDEFNSVIEAHPALEVVEIINNVNITNLQKLLDIKRLYGLTVTDTITDYNAIKSLKTLKYLSLPSEFLNDSIKREDLQRLLPGTVIVANEGICLGSGWLLLIIPLILILRLIKLQNNRKILPG